MKKKFFRIVEKNFKLLCRSRKSLLIILAIPLIMTLLLGFAFNNLKPYGLNIGIYIKERSDISDEIISTFQKNARVQFIDSEDICKKSVMSGELHACIIFRDGLEIETNEQNQVDFYVDYSKVNMIWMILDTISYPISSESKEISLVLTQTLLNKLINTDKILVEQLQIIENIKQDIDAANQRIIISKSTLTSLDLELDKFGTSQLKSAIDAVVQEISDAKSQINNIKSALSNLEGNLNSLGLDANNLLSDLNNKTNSLNIHIEDISEYKMAEVIAEFDILKDKFTKIKEKLLAAQSAKETVLSELNSVEQTLTSTSATLGSTKKILNEIHLDLGSFKITSAEKIVSPINSRIIPVTVEKTHLNHIFPSLLVLIAMFTSILLSSTAVIVEKKSKAFFRNFISPVDDLLFIFARYITDITTVGIQLMIFIFISYFLLKVQIAGLFKMITALLLISTLFILLGMIIGEGFNSQELSTLTTIAVSSIMLFFSNTILPIESMPPLLNKIAQFNPFVLAETLLRKTIIHNLGIALLAKEILLLSSYIIFIFIAIFIITKLKRQRW